MDASLCLQIHLVKNPFFGYNYKLKLTSKTVQTTKFFVTLKKTVCDFCRKTVKPDLKHFTQCNDFMVSQKIWLKTKACLLISQKQDVEMSSHTKQNLVHRASRLSMFIFLTSIKDMETNNLY